MTTDGPPTPPSRPVETVREIRISGKTIWQAIGAVIATLVVIWMLFKASNLVGMLVLSFFFSLALQPAVNRLHVRRGWKRGAAVGMVYLAGFVFVVFLVAVLLPAIVTVARAIGANASEWVDQASQWAQDTFNWTPPSVDVSNAADTVETDVSDWALNAFGTIVGIATTGLGMVFSLATIAMFTFYLTADAPRIQRAVLSLFDENTQLRVGWAWDEAVKQTGGYFYSRTILMVINGLGFFFTMVLVGMPVGLAVGLAVFGAFVSVFIPAVGTYIGGAIPVLVTLAIQGFVAALVVLGYVLVYQQVENYWLSPKISANTMSLNGGVAFGAALAGGAIAGPMGAFMSLPVAALIAAILSNYAATHEVVYVSPYADDLPEEPSEPIDESPAAE